MKTKLIMLLVICLNTLNANAQAPSPKAQESTLFKGAAEVQAENDLTKKLEAAEASRKALEIKLLAAENDLKQALAVKAEMLVDKQLFSPQPVGMAEGITPVAGEPRWVTSLRSLSSKSQKSLATAKEKGASPMAIKGIEFALAMYESAINRNLSSEQIAYINRYIANGKLNSKDIEDLREAIKVSGGSNTTASSPKVSAKSGTGPNLRPN